MQEDVKKNLSTRRHLVAIVGRPNVGKSTLFNRLTKRWQSIVEDEPGITRDRLQASVTALGHELDLVDTGGLNFSAQTSVEEKMSAQALSAAHHADLILFLLDGRSGLHPIDKDWVTLIRKLNKPTLFLVNKLDSEGLEEQNLNEFYELGVSDLLAISAEKKRGLTNLVEEILKALQLPIDASHQKLLRNPHKTEQLIFSKPLGEEGACRSLKLAIIGRPNVGKSTLLNSILGEERSLVDDKPGTTRDPIRTSFSVHDRSYALVDTAGIRRRAKTKTRVEKFSVMAALKAIDESDLSLLLIDGETGPTEQDAHVAGYAFEKQRALLLIVNKWDLGQEKFSQDDFFQRLELKMNFLNYCPVIFISAKTGKNVSKIFPLIKDMEKQLNFEVKTSALNKAFENIVEHHPLPTYCGREIKMFYATQVATVPPSFVIFCTAPNHVHFTYKRYLINALKQAFDLPNIPVRLIFKKR